MDKKELQEKHITITFFTDPLCCWSWGMYSQLQFLLKSFGNRITLDLCMGGMIPNWDNFNDDLLSIHRPSQMGPAWMQAAQKMSIPLNFMIWNNDPPTSSYPACLAVTAARLQSKEASERMYWMLSSAVMHHGQNISKLEVIEGLAEELLLENPNLFDLDVFKKDLQGKECRQEFKTDLEKVSFQKVERFPTLLLQNEVNRKRAMTVGYRTYPDLISVLNLITNGGNEIPK